MQVIEVFAPLSPVIFRRVQIDPAAGCRIVQNSALKTGRIVDLLRCQVVKSNLHATVFQGFDLAITFILHPC